jgi:uncharacterized membrane protein
MAGSFSSRSRVVRLLVARRRLFSSIIAGLLLLALLPGSMWMTKRLLLAWDLTAVIYVVFAFWMFARSTVDTCHRRARLYDEADWVILLLVIVSAAASFAAIFAELADVKAGREPASVGLAIACATVALSWTFTHTIFTLHYANVYYRPDSLGTPGGLKFPGDRPPHYGDFLYYSFVIGCATQTGDVGTVSSAMRRLTLIHGIVAFAFNTAILALMINVGAGLLF